MIDTNLEFWIYELIGDVKFQDWTDIENPGAEKTTRTVLQRVVCNDPADKICIGAYGKDEGYYQYDSYEAYYAADYFARDFEIHGLEINMYKVSVDQIHLKRN